MTQTFPTQDLLTAYKWSAKCDHASTLNINFCHSLLIKLSIVNIVDGIALSDKAENVRYERVVAYNRILLQPSPDPPVPTVDLESPGLDWRCSSTLS